MEIIRFIFWEAAKVLAVAFLAIVSVKSIAGVAFGRRWVQVVCGDVTAPSASPSPLPLVSP